VERANRKRIENVVASLVTDTNGRALCSATRTSLVAQPVDVTFGFEDAPRPSGSVAATAGFLRQAASPGQRIDEIRSSPYWSVSRRRLVRRS